MFKKLLGNKILFFDGAMGTMLQARGLKPGELPETWNITNAEVIEEIHCAYLEKGANIIKTNTFGANRLKDFGDFAVSDIVKAGVKVARKAVANRKECFVALDIGPTGKLLVPYGDLQFETAVEVYAEVVRSGVEAGADLILIETMSDTYEMKAAVLAAKENSDLPIVVTMTIDESGRLLNGASVTAAAIMLEGLGVNAIGFNCGLGPVQMQKLLPELVGCVNLPLVLNPNAGLPKEIDGKTVFDVEAEEFADLVYSMASEGNLAILGGCCGTTPEHIGALAQKCAMIKPQKRECNLTAVSAYGEAVIIGKKPVIIGERINPTGKHRLKQAIIDGDYDYICRLGLEQIDKGAEILDVNVGVPGIDEAKASAEAVVNLQAITSVPLQIDTANVDVMERSLRLYNGKPLLNSVNGTEESLEAVLPIAKKYGAAIVALTLDDNGISKTVSGRLTVAEKIINKAAEYGIEKRNIIVDPLALTVSTGGDNAQTALEIIKALSAKNIKTVMGVSNISFGLPNRDAINSTFFAMAMEAGLSCAIINPQSNAMMNTYYAFNALSGLDVNCEEYVKVFANEQKTQTAAMCTQEYGLYDAVVKGLQEQSRKAVIGLLKEKQPLEIINEHLIPALNFVGSEFEKKKLFLPQLLMSAEAAKVAFEVIKDAFSGEANDGTKESVVLATVKGDIHDIGKNIVKVIFENYGYKVVDLGKDVAPEAVVSAVKMHNPIAVGLSALMTTTVPAMEETIKMLKEEDCLAKVVVGGAVLTQEYADAIGADSYAPNAVSAVNYVNELIE